MSRPAALAFGRFSCVASADRWVITVSSERANDVTQRIAAQYLVLVGK